MKSINLPKLFSFILSPLLVGPLTIFLISLRNTSSIYRAVFYTVLFIIIGIIPSLAYILVQMKRGVISDIHVKDRVQRYPIYGIGMISGVVLLIITGLFHIPRMITSLLAAFLIVGLSSYFVNRRIKISIHTAAIAGATVVLFLTYGMFAGTISLILTWITMWSRVKIKAHTIREVVWGFILGSLITLAVFKLYLNL